MAKATPSSFLETSKGMALPMHGSSRLTREVASFHVPCSPLIATLASRPVPFGADHFASQAPSSASVWAAQFRAVNAARQSINIRHMVHLASVG